LLEFSKVFFQKKNACDSMTFLSQDVNQLRIKISHIDGLISGWFIGVTGGAAGVVMSGRGTPGTICTNLLYRAEHPYIGNDFKNLSFSGCIFVRP
jgi:hypothetical protein